MGTKSKYKEKTEGSKIVLKYIKAMLISLIITFAGIIIFAFVIKYANLSDSIIAPVNLVIKGVSIFLGAFVLTKNGSKGLLNGMFFAIIYTLIAFSVFSILAGTFVLGLGLIADFAFAIVVGGIGGLLGVNLKHKA